MKVVTMNRRQFLVGSGGTLLALPLLSSLPAAAQTGMKPPRRVVFVCSAYGIPGPALFGGEATTQLSAQIRSKALKDYPTEIGSVLKTHFNGVRDKVSLIRGLDVLGSAHHNRTAFLCAQVNGDHAAPSIPSVDVLLENSASVYAAGSASIKALRLNGYFGNQPGFGDPTLTWSWRRNNSGQLEKAPYLNNDKAAFDAVFATPKTPQPSAPDLTSENKFIMDRVLDSFNSLLKSRRLSAEDRTRLQDHAQRVQEIQGSFTQSSTGIGGQPASCGAERPAGYLTTQEVAILYRNYFKCVVTAMACAGTRVSVVYISHNANKYFIDHNGSMSHHHIRSHELDPVNNDKNPAYIEDTNFIAQRIAELANMMNETLEADGTRMLDNSLIVWGNELGEFPGHHRVNNMGLVTIGGFQGAVRPGYQYDYRQKDFPTSNGAQYTGHPMSQFLVGLMSKMGMPASEYSSLGENGAFGGWRKVDTPDAWVNRFKDLRNTQLPYFFT